MNGLGRTESGTKPKTLTNGLPVGIRYFSGGQCLRKFIVQLLDRCAYFAQIGALLMQQGRYSVKTGQIGFSVSSVSQ